MDKTIEGTSKPFRMAQVLNGRVMMKPQGGDFDGKLFEDCNERTILATKEFIAALGIELGWEGGVVKDIEAAADKLVQDPIDAKAEAEAAKEPVEEK